MRQRAQRHAGGVPGRGVQHAAVRGGRPINGAVRPRLPRLRGGALRVQLRGQASTDFPCLRWVLIFFTGSGGLSVRRVLYIGRRQAGKPTPPHKERLFSRLMEEKKPNKNGAQIVTLRLRSLLLDSRKLSLSVGESGISI